ncbi:hypothetical protein [Sinobaca sp. H24]|uniref:hypothetical protein n=1 Tax=Sinobaca sp. H24 TaxID=2923376 RepID=UPI002079E9A6|nr:hypothetical protein [Sinobaca sp. H24]
MTKDEVKNKLKEKQLSEALELVEDAEKGHLDELELVRSLGLLADEELNRETLAVLENEGVTIIYVEEDDE